VLYLLYLLYLVYLVNGGYVRAVQRVPTTALVTCLLVLGALGTTTGLDGPGRGVGLLCAAVISVALGVATTRHRTAVLGPADRVTLVRCALACGVAALTADSFSGSEPGRVLVGVAAVALVLDWVDGQVARRTGTASGFGAAFDMEVDAFLLLVLSVDVARSFGPWVLVIGAARYGLLLATGLVPWLRRPVPPRYWAKVVAATQGVVLVVAAADALPAGVVSAALGGAVALLAESFGHQVWWLTRLRAVEERGPSRTHERAAR
jgi:phosphatidylglycerophosphate synthase